MKKSYFLPPRLTFVFISVPHNLLLFANFHKPALLDCPTVYLELIRAALYGFSYHTYSVRLNDLHYKFRFALTCR
jgi:hypothetical protein